MILSNIYLSQQITTICYFTKDGKCFWMRVYEIPEGSKTSKGRAIQNLINLPPEDKVMAYLNVKDLKDKEYLDSHFVIMCTKNGIVKKTTLEHIQDPDKMELMLSELEKVIVC